jgi:UDP-GlcNAc:undecaprenyl-phosphate GlcNAc-1-phosphate transferase
MPSAYCLLPNPYFFKSRLGAVDWPDRRKNHLYPTPRLGGMAVFAGITISLLINGIWDSQIARLIICSGLLLGLGVSEDIFGVPAPLRLLVQIILAGILVQGGLMIKLIPQPSPLGGALNAFLTILWFVGITNAFNFFDGLDGLASGIAILITLFLGSIAFSTGQVHLGWVSVALQGAVLGFLPYNFKPRVTAELFLGDCGSTVLGFILAGLAVHGEWAVGHPLLNLAPPLLIFGVLIYDMVHVTITRIARGDVRSFRQWLETSGRDHMHHRFEALFRSKSYAVFVVLLLAFCFGLSALIIRQVILELALVMLLHSLVILILVTLLERAGNLHDRRKGSWDVGRS